MTFDVAKHHLVPKQSKLSDSEREKTLKQFQIEGKKLPRILRTDAAIAHLNAKKGDVIKIERESKTAGKSYYYRVVLDE